MIDLYYWPTPNGWKISIMLEECGLEYNMIPVNIGAGDQFAPEFLAISPNNRMPAIVDHAVEGEPVSVFESGAILIYLAEKTGKFMPADAQGRKETLEWLFWQVGNQGPMAGQLSHFKNYAPEGQDYGFKRYLGEYERNLAVLERRLGERCRKLLDLLYFRATALSYDEIARRMGMPRGSLGPTRRRCLDRMRKNLGPEWEGDVSSSGSKPPES